MIFLILTKCNDEFINIINNLNSLFKTIIVTPNDSSIKSFYNKSFFLYVGSESTPPC